MSKFKIGDRVIWSNPDRDTHPRWHYVKGYIIAIPEGDRDYYNVHPDTDGDDWTRGVGVAAYGYELERYYDKKERA